MDAMDVLNGCSLKRPTTSAPLPRDLRLCAPDLCFTEKLKRMPHLFPRVLELPLHAETPVTVVESRDSYRFQVRLPGARVDDVKVEALEIVPGATKVVVRGLNNQGSPDTDVAQVNLWRFRLPATTVPERSVASYEHEFLSVTVPKVIVSCNDDGLEGMRNDGEGDTFGAQEFEGETEEEQMQREVLEDLESFGSPRRIRSSPRSIPRKSSESAAVDLEKLQHEVLEDLESFGSPRRRRCTQSLSQQSTGSQDFSRSVGSWVGGFTVSVQ